MFKIDKNQRFKGPENSKFSQYYSCLNWDNLNNEEKSFQ